MRGRVQGPVGSTPPRWRGVVIGDIEAARLTCGSLTGRGATIAHLLAPSDRDLAAALTAEVVAVAILVRSDVAALRYALLVEHLRPGIRLVVTMFDRTVADQLRQAVPNCLVTSPADIAVPALVGACFGGPELAVFRDWNDGEPRALLDGSDGPRAAPFRQPRRGLRAALRQLATQLRPHDDSSRILVIGLGGLLGVLALDWLLGVAFLGHSAIGSFHAASRVVATVGPGPDESSAPHWYLVVSGVLMLAAIALTALFTAGIVHRIMSSRSVALLGRRTLPRRDHVVVVGLGQVGLRLATRLVALGSRVVVVEREPSPANLRMAKAAGIAVLVGDASERAVLDQLSLDRAGALAAMGSRDLDNVEVAIAARAVAPEARIVLRAGEDEVVAESRSLFAVGEVCDVSALTAAAVTFAVLDRVPDVVYPRGHRLFAWCDESEVAVEVGVRCGC